MSFCKSCHAEIVWLEHFASGKRMPVDAPAGEAGNIIASFADGQYRIATSFDPRHERHASHFATCPQAGEWRKKQ